MRGDNAKKEVVEKLSAAFGSDWIGEVDKKYYVWANDGGEKVQIAFALTCPKTNIGTPTPSVVNKPSAATKDGGWDWDSEVPFDEDPPKNNKVEITKEETDNIAAMLAKFGL